MDARGAIEDRTHPLDQRLLLVQPRSVVHWRSPVAREST